MGLIRKLALSALVLQMVLIVTGTAVRVTGSGLGCPTWPRCTNESLLNTPELGAHGYIEFGNRLLAVVMELVGIALVLAVRRYAKDRGWFRLALVQAAVVPVQAVIGGLLVLSDLNPYVLILHFLVSFVLVFFAVVLVHRVFAMPRLPHPQLRVLTSGVLAACVLAIVAGTLVTGTGPHAGDPKVDRLPFDPRSLTQLHADFVFLLLGLSLATAFLAWSTSLRRFGALLIGLIVMQGAIGYWQYFTSVPPVLVGMHVAGATLVFTTAAWLHQSVRQPVPPLEQTAEPSLVRAAGTTTAP
jgi:cytochrome c oxidase assembly protein subunit 15